MNAKNEPVAMSAAYCDRCGRSSKDAATEPAHEPCARRRRWEPPRYCAECGRRLVVQVLPGGWVARCSRHGESRG